ncbi:MAG: diguanylate cyclase [Gammaproteobacteria bacterium]|nr:diguanylate cyclase [Gammaproteobacteria bacterium]
MRKLFGSLLAIISLNLTAQQTLSTDTTVFHLDAVKYRIAAIKEFRGLDLTNSTIVSDDKGYLWVGTQDGLVRIDAFSSKRFVKSNKSENSIAGNFITKITYQSSKQYLWIGTATGLSRYHLPTETFKSFNDTAADKSISAGYIQSIFIDQQDTVWIGTRKGLSRFDESSNSFVHVPLKVNSNENESATSIMDIKQNETGELWVATHQGIMVLLDNSVIRNFQPIKADSNKRHVITGLLFQSQDTVWIGTEQNGLLLYDIENDKITPFTQESTNSKLPSNYIRSLLLSKSRNEIWVGTDGGLSIYHTEKREFLPLFNNESISEGIVALYEDNNGIIWIGTWSKGLHRFNPNETQIGTFSRKLLSSLGENLRRIIRGKEDDIWFSNYSTLFQLKTQKNLLTRYDIAPVNLAKNRAIPIWNSKENTLYLLTRDLYRIKEDSRYDEIRVPDEIRDLSWYGANFDSKGQLWLRSRNLGIFCLDPSLKKVIHQIPTSISGFARQIDESTMVFGTQQASYFVNINSFETIEHNLENTEGMLNVNITGYYKDSKDRVWMGTSGGIHELVSDITEPKYHTWSIDEGLPTDVITGPIPDNFGYLWFSSTDGLIRFDPNRETITQYDIDAGALSNYSIGQYTKDPKQRLYFLGPAGISVIDQSTISESPPKNRVIISDVLIRSSSSRQESVDQLSQIIEGKPTNIVEYRESITLPPESREFSVEFTTPYSGDSKKEVFYFRLIGFNEKWSETSGENRRATYTNLEPGTYIFEVYSTNSHGVPSSSEEITIILEPFFYETLWFKTLIVLILMSLAAAWYRYRVNKIKEYNLLLEKQVEQRTRDINTLADIGRDIVSVLEIDDLSEHLYHHINRSLEINVVGIGVYDPANELVRFEKSHENGKALPTFSKPMDTTAELAAWCVHYGKEVVMQCYEDRNNYLTTTEKSQIGERMESIIYIPIVSRNESKLGCITIQSSKVNAFTEEDLQFIRTIANYTSIALDNTIAHHELKRISFTDYLTDLPNRRAFLEQSRYQISINNRSVQPISFAIADIDNFKTLNDTYGHDSGDIVLQRVAKIFRSALRTQDLIARWGGEEFVFMLPNTDCHGAKIALEKARKSLEKETFLLKDQELRVTSTFGICQYKNKLSIEEIIDLADRALYTGKESGRNQVQVITETGKE